MPHFCFEAYRQGFFSELLHRGPALYLLKDGYNRRIANDRRASLKSPRAAARRGAERS